MMSRSGKIYLKDILEAIEKIGSYVKDLSFEDFSHNEMVIDAVIRNFEVIGEATKNLPANIKSSRRNIPWKEMSGMRDKMIHEYFGVDLDIVWKTIKQSLPGLEKSLKSIFKNLK